MDYCSGKNCTSQAGTLGFCSACISKVCLTDRQLLSRLKNAWLRERKEIAADIERMREDSNGSDERTD